MAETSATGPQSQEQQQQQQRQQAEQPQGQQQQQEPGQEQAQQQQQQQQLGGPDGEAINAEKEAAAKELREHRTEWLQQQLGAYALSKMERRIITDMAYSILMLEDLTPKEALTAAYESSTQRMKLREQLGQDLNPSSPVNPSDPSRQPTPEPQVDPAPAQPRGRAKGKARERKQKRQRRHSSSSRSDSQRGSSDSDTTSTESSGSDTDRRRRRWVPGKVNTREYGALEVPRHISKKVAAGDFVDM